MIARLLKMTNYTLNEHPVYLTNTSDVDEMKF